MNFELINEQFTSIRQAMMKFVTNPDDNTTVILGPYYVTHTIESTNDSETLTLKIQRQAIYSTFEDDLNITITQYHDKIISYIFLLMTSLFITNNIDKTNDNESIRNFLTCTSFSNFELNFSKIEDTLTFIIRRWGYVW